MYIISTTKHAPETKAINARKRVSEREGEKERERERERVKEKYIDR